MKKQRSEKIDFSSLISDIEEKSKHKIQGEPNISNKVIDTEILKKTSQNWVEKIVNFSFLKKDVSALDNKTENTKITLALVKEFGAVYDKFKIFDMSDFKINMTNVFKATGQVTGLMAVFLSVLLVFLGAIQYVLIVSLLLFPILFNFFMKDKKINGYTNELLHRKYKSAFAFILMLKPYIKNEEDFIKVFQVLVNTNDVNLKESEIDIKSYVSEIWKLIENESGITDLEDFKKSTNEEVTENLDKIFKKLIEKRNSSLANQKHYDILIEIFTHQGIKEMHDMINKMK